MFEWDMYEAGLQVDHGVYSPHGRDEHDWHMPEVLEDDYSEESGPDSICHDQHPFDSFRGQIDRYSVA